MNNNKVLSALSYISILFAPFILPLIVYLVIDDTEVKHHAKRAFLSHLIPTVLGFILGIVTLIGAFAADYDQTTSFGISMIVLVAIYLIIIFIVVVWNIIQTVRVVR